MMYELMTKRKLGEFAESLTPAQFDLLKAEVILAYQAGLCRFNALTHDVVEYLPEEGKDCHITNFEPTMERDDMLLLTTYLKEKGYD